MSDPSPPRGLTMLDGVALVTGAAVASVHFREFAVDLAGLGPRGWAMVSVAYAWLSLTSAGPFLFLVRRAGRRLAGYPGVGDLTWLAMGLPWLLAALYLSALGTSFDATNRLYGDVLLVAMMVSSGFGMVRLGRVWSATGDPSPETGPRSWTDAAGRAIAATWPLQMGLGFLVIRW